MRRRRIFVPHEHVVLYSVITSSVGGRICDDVQKGVYVDVVIRIRKIGKSTF